MSGKLWEYGGYWLAQTQGSDAYYACWYDAERCRTRRRTLGTKVYEDAQKALISLAGVTKLESSRAADKVMILAALDHYYENDVSGKPSANQAFRAISLVRDFLKEKMSPTATVSAFGPIRQREFMTWCLKTHQHSASTIARNLSVVSAAFRFGKRLVVVKDGLGNQHEVQLIETAPDVVTQAPRVAELLKLPTPSPREWLPTFDELGRFIDAIDKRKENLFRFVILALNTWARPQTIIDFRDEQETVNRRFGTLDLNPPGRRQTVKYRPKIRLTKNLRGWLDYWKGEDPEAVAPLMWDGEPIAAIKRTFDRHAEDCGLPSLTPGTIRHFMATMVRREKPPVSKEQRDVWLGHDETRTASSYESFDPDYLTDCAQATENIIAQLQAHTTRPLDARKLRAKPSLRVVGGSAA